MALRPFLPADAPLLAEIFRSSIEELTADDYSPEQRRAWVAAAGDEKAFAAHLAGNLTFIATFDGSPVGFLSLRGEEQIDMLYVHPAAVGRGVATLLCDAVERIAASRGTPRLVADTSDTARGFFERRGYVAQRRNTVSCGGEWLVSTTVEKRLTQTPERRRQ
jgi:putative acetyltransferase